MEMVFFYCHGYMYKLGLQRIFKPSKDHSVLKASEGKLDVQNLRSHTFWETVRVNNVRHTQGFLFFLTLGMH